MDEYELPVNEGESDATPFIAQTYGRAGDEDLAAHPPASPHLLIRASAGTGKTYRLTTRYLRLLRAGETAEHILATTFTRKAAGEVLGRVLGWLARASVDANERAAMDAALGGYGLSERDCLDMLRRLVGGLHRLSIGTIDSFFSRAARALRFELDIPADPVITDDGGPLARALRLDAIQQALGKAAATDDGFQALIELLRRVHHDTARRSVTDTIDALVVGLYDVYRQHDEGHLWTTLNPPPTLSTELLNLAVQSVVELGEHIPVTKAGEPRKSWAKAYDQLTAAAQQHDFDTFLEHTICQRLLDDTAEQKFDRFEIPDLWRDALLPVITHARARALQQLAHLTESTYHLLDGFAAHYEQAKRSAGVLMFSDLTHKLANYLPTLGEDMTAEFYYRLDSRVTHLLLDEFQDTSLPQWRVLEPFAEEVTATADGERSFFCVGDEKQAIYGWRGGCAELFSAVEELPGVTPWTMTRSRRSSPVVLDAVNQVFSSLTGNAALKDEKHGGRWDAAVAQWAERFETHAAHHESLPGHVLLKTTAPKPAGEPEDDVDEGDGDADAHVGNATPHESYCADHIAALVEASPGRSVGVLVRRKKAAAGLLAKLRAMGVAVSEEGGNPIDHTPAVSAALAAIQLADHPGDRVAAFHVANSPLGAVVGLTDGNPSRASAVGAATRIRIALLDRGFGETIAGWCKRVALSCDARSLRRMEQLVALAQQYDLDMAATSGGLPGAALRVGGFVEVVRQARVQSPTPAAVRVMTLHAAKGLEFDTVVLPDLNGVLSANDHGAQVMLDRDSPIDEPRAIIRRVQRDKLVALGLEHLADREDALRRGEDLCLLYVGMTRAKHALHLLVEPLAQTKNGLSSVGQTNLSFAAILRQSLAGEFDEGADGNEVLFESGAAGWSGGDDDVPMTTGQPEAPQPTRVEIKLAPAATPLRSRPVRLPSDGSDVATVSAADLLKLSDPAGRSFGSAMHAVCERLGFVDEEELPDEGAVAAALRLAGIEPTAEQVDAYTQRLQAMLDAPPVRDALSRGGAADLWRERSFAVVLEGNLLRGVFDRVHVWRNSDGQATHARLIDFKTDRLPDAEAGGAQALAEHYAPQVNAYRAALAGMLKLDSAAIEAMLILTGEAQVVEIKV